MNSTVSTYRRARITLALSAMAAAASLLIHACGDTPTGPADRLELEPATLELGEARTAQFEVRNTGSRAIGPVELGAGAVTDESGAAVAGARVDLDPQEIPTLNPGGSAVVALTLDLPGSLQAGAYSTTVSVDVGGRALAELGVGFDILLPAAPDDIAELEIVGGATEPRQGDVSLYTAEARDSAGAAVADSTLTWSVEPGSAGFFAADGRFVGFTPGAARVIARSASGLADTLEITIAARGLSGSLDPVGHGEITARFTSDLWVHGGLAYTGTWNCRDECGNRLYVWDVGNPSSPQLVDSVMLNARVVNDVKVRADGQIAVSTHEFSDDGLHGITVLDLTDPAHPEPVARLTEGLESFAGVHNVWIEGDYVYVVLDDIGNGLRVVDISDPAEPHVISGYYAGSSFLHDVYVRDGLAFLSHWDAGLVILDVGHGIAGGSPTNPVEVSRIRTAGGQTHNAWYWPEGGYVFVGEEDFGTPGVMHVVDVSDLREPVEVATYAVAGDTPHNFWLDEGRAVLYMAWYTNGIRALDVSGELLGALDRQGREIFGVTYAGGGGCFGGTGTCTWAPQLEGDLIFASDPNTGLHVLRPSF